MRRSARTLKVTAIGTTPIAGFGQSINPGPHAPSMTIAADSGLNIYNHGGPDRNDRNLRARLATEFHAPSVTSSPVGDRRPRRWMIGAVAASAALLTGGLALTRDNNRTVVDATDGAAPTGVVVETDPAAVSLDSWVSTGSAVSVDPSVVVIDRASLPAGWQVSDEDGQLMVYPADMIGYTYEAVVTIDDTSAFKVTFTNDPTGTDRCFIALAGVDEPASIDLAGTLSGVRWAVATNPTRVDLYVAGSFSSGMGLSLGESPTLLEGTIDGVPGYGAVAYGRVHGDAVSVTVTASDSRTASLPLSTTGDRTIYAIPIPDTVDIATLTFISADGTVLRIADVPNLPSGYESGIPNLAPRG